MIVKGNKRNGLGRREIEYIEGAVFPPSPIRIVSLEVHRRGDEIESAMLHLSPICIVFLKLTRSVSKAHCFPWATRSVSDLHCLP